MKELDTRSHDEFAHKKEVLAHVLADRGILLPDYPDESRQTPGPWLVRTETNKQRLLAGEAFYPQPGQWGTHGVFLGDCLSSLMYPRPGAYYVFKTEDLGGPWLIAGSQAFEKILHYEAEKYHADLQTIDGYIETESQIYKTHSMYQPKIGVLTIHTPVPVQRARHIFVTPGLLSGRELSNLDTGIINKISIIHF